MERTYIRKEGDMAKCIAKHWMTDRHYIAEIDNPKCLAMVTTDSKGTIVKCVILGLKEEGGKDDIRIHAEL